MADIEIIQPIPRQDPISLIEKDELVEGGPEGAANRQAIAIANNIEYLKERTYSKSDVDDLLNDLQNLISAAEKGVLFYETATELLNSELEVNEQRAAQALDTRDLYLWRIKSAAGVDPVIWGWVNTGQSDLARMEDFVKSRTLVYDVYKKINGYATVATDENGNSRIILLSDENSTIVFDSRIDLISNELKEVQSNLIGLSVYKNIAGFVTIYLDENGSSRIKELSIDGLNESFLTAKQKTLIAGNGILLSEGEETIRIEVSAVAGQAPYEFVLCLVIGQSNNTTEGGDIDSAPLIPANTCFIWDNVYNRLTDINQSPQRASIVPAMAMEFFKNTGMGLIVVNSAVGASAMSEAAASTPGRSWDIDGDLRQTAIERFRNCKTYLDANGFCYQTGFISWAQGEQDGAKILDGTITIDDYKTAFNNFIDFIRLQVGIKTPFIVTRTGYRAADNEAYKAIRSAQMQFCSELSGVYMGYTGTIKFFERGLMSDGVHYSQAGKNIVGTNIGRIAAKLSAGVN